MIAPAVVGLNFRWLFNSQYGFIDALLADLHLPAIPWLSDPNWALVSIIIADVWQNTPLMVLLFLADLQSLPLEPLEAAAVDGASPWQIFWNITLPLMRPVIMVALMLRIIDTFRTFDVVWLMTQGGPGGATSLVTVHAYLLAFPGRRFRACGRRLLHCARPIAPAARRPLRSPVADGRRDGGDERRDDGRRVRRSSADPPTALSDWACRALCGAHRYDPAHAFSACLARHHVAARSVRYFRRSRAHHSGVHNLAPVRQCLHPVQSGRLPLEHDCCFADDSRLRDGARCPLRLCDGAVPPALPSRDRLAASHHADDPGRRAGDSALRGLRESGPLGYVNVAYPRAYGCEAARRHLASYRFRPGRAEGDRGIRRDGRSRDA